MKDVHASQSQNSEGLLLALLTAGFYVLFTLLSDSHSLMVRWYEVILWQIGLICSVLWLLLLLWHQRRVQALGNGLDWLVGLVVIGLIISTVFAEFRNQALWYGWAALCFIAALYALNYYLNTPQRRYRLLVGQGYLNLAFILISLSLWTTQTLRPELARLEELEQYGVNLSFDFSVLELRNWAPLGHQNYVAGYLLLSLPLLVGLSILQAGWRRWLWLAGVGLGLLDLYTTSSRGGWLGLVVLCIFSLGVLLVRSSIPRLWLGLGGVGTLAILSLLILANNRLRTLIMAVLRGQGGRELAYRMINATIGWHMGSTHPWSGIGLGGVPLLYQKYRPIWAGRESELAYQLHSTPVQLWAEMGLWGIIPGLGAIALLIYLLWRWLRQTTTNHTDQILLWSIYGGLLAYGVISLTDYQLDNICISGTLVIYLACLASIFRTQKPDKKSEVRSLKSEKIIPLAGLGILLAVIIWLIPVHRAWQLSRQGFIALSQDDVDTFVERLSRAQQLVPWEPYYPYQLGWNLGNLALQTSDAQKRQQLFEDSIAWLQKGIAASPYWEFGHSNLAWLLLNPNPEAATQEFARSAQLVPAKRGVMYGLGLSLLAQNKVDLAIEAIALEGLRDPLFITSPIWVSPGLKSVYPPITERMAAKYTELLQQDANNSYLHRCRGGLYWWQGNLAAARADLEAYGTPLSQLMLELSEGKAIEPKLSQMPASAGKLALAAWLNPSPRQELLQQAWIMANKTVLPANIQQKLLSGMESSSSFEQWLKQKAPVLQYRRQRPGFGVVSRHLDGPAPIDFWTVVENVAMANWFEQLLPSPVYAPELDFALQPQRDNLLQTLNLPARA
ncbi:MAG: O-antigen ligase family protein [Xenococcaceae cyanobacterium]